MNEGEGVRITVVTFPKPIPTAGSNIPNIVLPQFCQPTTVCRLPETLHLIT